MQKNKKSLGIVALLLTTFGISASPYPILLIFTYAVHEIGHLLTAHVLGADVKWIRGRTFGLSIGYDSYGISYQKEAIICTGGIVFNLITAIISGICTKSFNNHLTVLNLSLAIMNLYPVSILDGGGILKNLLLTRVSEAKAEKIAFGVSFISSILMWLVAVYFQIVFMNNISLFIISVVLLVQLCFSII